MDKIMDIRESTRFRDEALKKKQKLLDGIVAEKRGYTDDEKVRVDALTNEIEKYDGINGILIAWVKIDPLFNECPTDTDIYIYYGNASITSSTEGSFITYWRRFI